MSGWAMTGKRCTTTRSSSSSICKHLTRNLSARRLTLATDASILIRQATPASLACQSRPRTRRILKSGPSFHVRLSYYSPCVLILRSIASKRSPILSEIMGVALQVLTNRS